MKNKKNKKVRQHLNNLRAQADNLLTIQNMLNFGMQAAGIGMTTIAIVIQVAKVCGYGSSEDEDESFWDRINNDD